MTYFLLIMVVFLMAYGVAQQAILFPHEHGSWSLIPKVFFRPYFQVYGELFIEDTTYSGKFFFYYVPLPTKGVFPYKGYICLLDNLVRNSLSILAILVSNRVWF